MSNFKTRLNLVLDAAFSMSGGEREFPKKVGQIVSALAIAIAAYHIYTFSIGIYDPFRHRIIHFGLITAFCFLVYSFFPSKSNKLPLMDIILALITLAITAYLAMNFQELVYKRQPLDPTSLANWQVFLGCVLILLSLEVTRRALGPVMGYLAIIAMAYCYFGPYLKGTWWYHRGYSFTQIIDFTVFSAEGIFGPSVNVSATYIIMFLVFAAFFRASGAGQFFINLAHRLAGRARGGPAKVSVVGSCLMGTVTGSAAANIVTVGSMTIPMMKKVGFSSEMAGAIEAAASTGSHTMPPVMAGVIFLMSELTGLPYIKIAAAAAIPGLLFYLGIYVQVHLYAVRHGIGGMEPGAEIPTFGKLLREGWQYVLPLVSIVWLLIIGYSPIPAALWSSGVVLVVSWFRKETRMGIKEILKALESSVMSVRYVLGAMVLSGIIMAAVFYTGLGDKFVSLIRGMSGDSLFQALLLTAVVSLFLGLPLNMTASYILVLMLIIPATVAMGVKPMAAHLFCIYFASVEGITPPVGGLFFMAASMAESKRPFRVGWLATRLAIGGFVIPFAFVYRPALLLMGSVTEIVTAVIVAAIAISCLGAAAEGWLLTRLNYVERIILGLGGFCLIGNDMNIAGIGIGLMIAIFISQGYKVKFKKDAQAV